jgi:hypothetical protein
MLLIPGILASKFVPQGDFESIATVVVGSGGASEIEFTSIPSTYQHLQVRILAQSTRATFSADNIRFRLNDDTGSNYSRHFLSGDGASASSGATSSTDYMWCGQMSSTVTANIFGVAIIDILDYSNVNKFTTIRSLFGVDLNGINNTISGSVGIWSGNWRNTNAVTKMVFNAQSAGYAEKTHFALYGIKG